MLLSGVGEGPDKTKGTSAVDGYRRKVARRVLIVASLLVLSLMGSSCVLLWTAGIMGRASSVWE
jgi:hypothetical protein